MATRMGSPARGGDRRRRPLADFPLASRASLPLARRATVDGKAVPWTRATRAHSRDGSLLLVGPGRGASPVLRRGPRPPGRRPLWFDVPRGRRLAASLRRQPFVRPVATPSARRARADPHLLRRSGRRIRRLEATLDRGRSDPPGDRMGQRRLEWDNGVRSFYFHDPAGNVLEIADGDLWPKS